jgi:REP element-mobilizing transposase RayT
MELFLQGQYGRSPLTLLNDHLDLLRAVFRQVPARHPFTIEAAVILPDHLHAIWTLPEQDADFALRWRLIENALSHCLMRGADLRQAEPAKASAGFGNGGIGSTRCVTKPISPGISIIFTSIR